MFRLLQTFTDEKYKDRLAELQSRLHLDWARCSIKVAAISKKVKKQK
jgi:hypothetical protein